MVRRKKRSSRSTLPIYLKQIAKRSPLLFLVLSLLWVLHPLAETIIPSPIPPLPAIEGVASLYSNQAGDQLTTLYQRAIEGAEHSIVLSIYAMTDPLLIQTLDKKAAAGVSVTVICDAKASPHLTARLPHAKVVRRVGQGLMHQKILVIDERQVWLGSANFTPSSLKVHGNLVNGFDHPPLAQLIAARIQSMDEEGERTPLPSQQVQLGSQHMELWMLPDNSETASQRLKTLLRSARKTIKVAMFTWTRFDFAQELLAARKRGVQVEVAMDRQSGKGANAKVVRLLTKGGIPVRFNTGQGLLHHKFAYIDDEVLVNGSANWTYAAFKNNDDCFMIISSLTPQQNTHLQHMWKVILKQSEPVHNK